MQLPIHSAAQIGAARNAFFLLLILAVCSPSQAPHRDAVETIPQTLLSGVSAQSLRGHLSFVASDLLEGRYTPSRGLDICADYIVVDTLRVSREVFAQIWEAWRDGYTDSIVEHTGISRAEVEQRFREMIACARDPKGYALWQVPVWTAQKPR